MFLIILIITIILLKLYQRVTCGKCTSTVRLVGKVAIVTGANTGIGFETAKDFAKRGARVILACRDDTRGAKAQDQIIQDTGNENVKYKKLDLSSLDSVRRFSKHIRQTESRLHILVNNAGAADLGAIKSKDGIVTEMQINYFGHFLLTILLLPLLIKSTPSRIINVASIFHYIARIDFSKINREKYYDPYSLYANSKLCMILFTKELSRRLAGSGVIAHSVHPGAVYTGIFRNHFAPMRVAVDFVFKNMFKSSCEGAQTTIHAAVSQEAGDVSGKYYVDCVRRGTSAKARDATLARDLWEYSEKLVYLEEHEMFNNYKK